jgi:crotonobetainyl-CoA:carnitine CoA-transferase CaiB-like acyl-CoA transferase
VYQTFQTADAKMIFVAITSDNHWRAFCAEWNLPDLLADPGLKTNPQRAQQRERIRPIVAAKIAAENYDDLAKKLERLKIPFGPLAKPGDLFDDPHLNHAGRMIDIVLPTGKHAKIPGIPLEMSGHTPGLRLQPPKMGEHTRAILLELGYSEADADDLIVRGVAIGLEEAKA